MHYRFHHWTKYNHLTNIVIFSSLGFTILARAQALLWVRDWEHQRESTEWHWIFKKGKLWYHLNIFHNLLFILLNKGCLSRAWTMHGACIKVDMCGKFVLRNWDSCNFDISGTQFPKFPVSAMQWCLSNNILNHKLSLVGMQQPEKYKENRNVSSEGPLSEVSSGGRENYMSHQFFPAL
jgi:hypothetical protein